MENLLIKPHECYTQSPGFVFELCFHASECHCLNLDKKHED